MDSSANSLINPDARMGLAGAQPGAGAAGAGQAGGAADLGGLGSNLGGNFGQRLSGLAQMRGNPRAPLIFAVALLVAVVAGLFLWSRAPDYKVLYSNLSDRDGGAIIASLQQMNVPYKFADGGGAILVPADQVHEVRLKLAAPGPAQGRLGRLRADGQPEVRHQPVRRAGQLPARARRRARALDRVDRRRSKSARVHLALPKPSVFVREQKKPDRLGAAQPATRAARSTKARCSAIVHLVSSQRAGAAGKNVTVVDQNGNLLSAASAGAQRARRERSSSTCSRSSTARQQRIEAILAPIVGAGNVRAAGRAPTSTSRRVEQTAENYSPNQDPQQRGDPQPADERGDRNAAGGAAGGVPGALSNQPPQRGHRADRRAGAGRARRGRRRPTPAAEPQGLDHQLRSRQDGPPLRAARWAASSACRWRWWSTTSAWSTRKGKVTMQPLTADEDRADQRSLVKEAMGFDQERGDSVNVVNSAVHAPTVERDADVPWWSTPDMIALGKQIAQVPRHRRGRPVPLLRHGEAGAAPRVPAAGVGRRRGAAARRTSRSLLDGAVADAERDDGRRSETPTASCSRSKAAGTNSSATWTTRARSRARIRGSWPTS